MVMTRPPALQIWDFLMKNRTYENILMYLRNYYEYTN